MTTQPSDWAVRKAFLELTEAPAYEVLNTHFREEVLIRARELDASGGGVEPVAWISPRGDLIDNERFQSRLNGLPDFGDLSGYRPLYATPRAAEAGDWLPIESAPRDGSPFLVYLPKERKKIQTAWQNANGVMVIGSSFSFDLSPATHWRPLPPAPQAAMGAVGAGD